MRASRKRFLIALGLFCLSAAGIAYSVRASRGFRVRLENRSTRTLERVRFTYEDGVIEIARLAPGETARARFRPRPNDGEGGEIAVEFVRKGISGREKDRKVGIGLFATRGIGADLVLTDAPIPDGRLGVKLEGSWTESFDWKRWATRARFLKKPNATKWPAMILDEDP